MAVSLQATALPLGVIAAGMWIAYSVGGGLYGLALAAAAMLSMAGVAVAIDSYDPITDNAAGIAELAELPHGVRTITDALNAVGQRDGSRAEGLCHRLPPVMTAETLASTTDPEELAKAFTVA